MSRALGAVLFFGTALALLAGLHAYLHRRLIRDVALPRPWRIGLTLALAAAGLSLPLSVILGRGFGLRVGQVLSWPAYAWMGCMFLLFVLLVFADGARWLATLSARALGRTAPADPARRVFISRGLALSVAALALGLSVVALLSARQPPRIQRIPVVIDRLPRASDGLRLVQITDLHVGDTVRRSLVEDVVRRTNELRPDIIAITGDLVDGSVATLRHDVAPLGDLRARHGTFFVTGNHEYYSGVTDWIDHLRSLGIRVLRNERVTIRQGDAAIDLAGVDDSSAHRSGGAPGHGADVDKALAGLDPQRVVVLFAHQPKEVARAARHGVDLVLSGHTHGGQIWPWGLLVGLTQPYVSGLHLHQGRTWIYVSSGTGHWGPPMRLAAPAEITLVELRARRL